MLAIWGDGRLSVPQNHLCKVCSAMKALKRKKGGNLSQSLGWGRSESWSPPLCVGLLISCTVHGVPESWTWVSMHTQAHWMLKTLASSASAPRRCQPALHHSTRRWKKTYLGNLTSSQGKTWGYIKGSLNETNQPEHSTNPSLHHQRFQSG